MSLWTDRILGAFPVDISRMWIASDPDGVLLDETILTELRLRGFEVLPFEDSIVFRADYEERFRQHWDRGVVGAASALILHTRSKDIAALPWDYLQRSRQVDLSLADLFSRFSYAVVRQIDSTQRAALYDAHERHSTQTLGDAATREFVLLHIFRLSPHLISRVEDLWREVLRLHFRTDGLPIVFAAHIAQVLSEAASLKRLPISELFASKSVMLKCVQDAWSRYVEGYGLTGSRVGEESLISPDGIDIPFDHPDIRVYIDSMFLDGSLHPLVVSGPTVQLPEWAKPGVIEDPFAMRNLVAKGIDTLSGDVPGLNAGHRDWGHWARRFGEMLARFHSLDSARAESVSAAIQQLQAKSNAALLAWCQRHYGDMPSLPLGKVPVMVHHVPRFLAMKRASGEEKVALLVFDGLAVDQWVVIRERLDKTAPNLTFDEGSTFAWLPTLTSVSRQALFSGLRPREFADSIETTSPEPQQWTRFWQDQGLNPNQVAYKKGLKRNDQLEELGVVIGNPSIKAIGIVVDTVDEIIHGAVLGKRGVANQIETWCETGFIDRLFAMLLGNGFSVYLTADHGNVEAIGVGRPSQGLAAEMRGERVRTYRNLQQREDTAKAWPGSAQLDLPGMPPGFFALYAAERSAFVPPGEHTVVHGGISVEEMIVPFVKVHSSA